MKLNVMESSFTKFVSYDDHVFGNFVILGTYVYHGNEYFCVYFGGSNYNAYLFNSYSDAVNCYKQIFSSHLNNGFSNICVVSYENYFDKTISGKKLMSYFGYMAKIANAFLELGISYNDNYDEILTIELCFEHNLNYKFVQPTLFNKVM